jgi:hypothetical protein
LCILITSDIFICVKVPVALTSEDKGSGSTYNMYLIFGTTICDMEEIWGVFDLMNQRIHFIIFTSVYVEEKDFLFHSFGELIHLDPTIPGFNQ